MNEAEQIKLWARELKAISQTGLAYGKDAYDLERYGQMNDLANQMLAHVSGKSLAEIDELLPIEKGYATPKIAVRGVVIRDGQVLMVKETADGRWSLPGGWCDVGLTPAENIEKEIEEETGLQTKATRLLCFYDQIKYRASVTMQHIYTVYFLCEVIEGELIESSLETAAVRFFDQDKLPPLSTERITTEQLMKALSNALDSTSDVYFD